VITARWTVHYTSRDLPQPSSVLRCLRDLLDSSTAWLDEAGIPDGLPFLLSPRFEYDVVLNSYFHRVALIGAPPNSNANRARALAGFLNYHRATTTQDMHPTQCGTALLRALDHPDAQQHLAITTKRGTKANDQPQRKEAPPAVIHYHGSHRKKPPK
jgi:hypothetical protein